jgi:hypothetical protein
LLSDDVYGELHATLVKYPKAGPVIPGSGGTRVIYYWATEQDHLLMLFIYTKNESDDLTPDQIKMLRHIVEREYP